MQFKFTTVGLLLATQVQAALWKNIWKNSEPTATEVIADLKDICTESIAADDKIKNSYRPDGVGENIVYAYEDIIAKEKVYIQKFGLGSGAVVGLDELKKRQSPEFRVDKQNKICEGLVAFMNAQTSLLKTTMVQKEIIAPVFPIVAVADVLREHDGALDILILGTFGFIPKCVEDLKPQVDDFHEFVLEAVRYYSGPFP